MSTSDIGVEFTCRWQALAPNLKMTTPPILTGDEDATTSPQIPWVVAFDGTAFRLTVGPVPLTGGPISDALTTLHQLRSSTGLARAVAPVIGRSTSVRLLVRRAVPPTACEILREVLAEPLVHLLGQDALGRFVARVDSDGVVLDLAQPLPPEMSDRILPMLAGLGAVVVCEAPDGSLPPDGIERLWTSARNLLAGIVSREDLAILGALAAESARPAFEIGSSRARRAPSGFESDPVEIIQFRPNARPVDEVEQPGTGCTESIGLVSSDHKHEEDMLWILFRLNEVDEQLARDGDGVDVRMSAWFTPGLGSPLHAPVPVPGLTDEPARPNRVSEASYPQPALERVPYEAGSPSAYVAEIDLQRAMLPGTPGSRWRWNEADTALRSVTPDGDDPFTFAHLFKQRLTVELAVDGDARRAGRQSTEIDVFDIGRVGSLYDRLITQLVSMDTQAQAKARGLKRVYHAYHPWYPVLAIGLTKAQLYMRAVQEDAYWQRRNLADPGWLMRVGVYLEFLTFLGIAEAVKDEFPNLLSPTERRCFEESVAFEQIRRRIDTHAWRQAWDLHGIVFASNPMTAAGPVDFRNLFQKETANLAFLEAHHADLKHAVELAGPNLDSAQQTWHHVYRAAERAVLNASQTVFPEFRHLGATYQHFVLWHERGKFPVGKAILPPWLTAAVGDRDGVYPTAARRYRDSMNEVAEWARERGLMDYSGDECVPRTASLIESQLEGENERYFALQVMDGFRQPMETPAQHDDAGGASAEVVVGMLRAVEIFEPLTVSEIWQLAHQVERRAYGPGEDILVQGDPPSSLNIIERGSVEVLVRQEDGTVLPVDRMGKSDVFGEFALLTGQAVSATVRALDTIIVHQIPKSALQPIIEARPELVVELCVMLADRRVNRRTKSEDYLFGSSGPSDAGSMGRMVSRVRDYLLS